MSEQDLNHTCFVTGLKEVGCEAVPQRMRRKPVPWSAAPARHVAGAVELPRRNGQERIARREQPALRSALPPPRAQHFEQPWRELGVPVLAALALFDPDQHALAVDVGDRQGDHTGRSADWGDTAAPDPEPLWSSRSYGLAKFRERNHFGARSISQRMHPCWQAPSSVN